jgi:hypothetical protein
MPGLTIEQKIGLLAGNLNTQELREKLDSTIEEYKKALFDQALHRSANAEYIASYGADCDALKEKMAMLHVPISHADGKKIFANKDEKTDWLLRERQQNPDLIAIIKKQNTVSFIIESDRANVEILIQKIQNMRTVITLKTAVINFLAS